jgi:hypothetical protein
MESIRMNNISNLSLSKKALFSLLPLIVIIFFLETFFRFYTIHEDSGPTVTGFLIPDEDLIWRLMPYNDGPLATNELGLRDTPYKSSAEHKILLLGDSVSWGDGIENLKDAYPYLTEKILNQPTNV